MTWENILKIDVIKFEDMMRETWRGFGLKLINTLKSAGFEIKHIDDYEKHKWDKHSKDWAKIREYTHMTEEDLKWDEGYGSYGHELIITDHDEPYAYGDGFRSATLTIKYIEDDFTLINNPQNEDFPHKKVTTFKIEEVSMTTGAKRNIDVKMNMENISNSQAGRRDFLQRILEVFKEYAEYEEDWGDMSEEEQRTERGERAGRRFAGGAWAAGHRENVWDE